MAVNVLVHAIASLVALAPRRTATAVVPVHASMIERRHPLPRMNSVAGHRVLGDWPTGLPNGTIKAANGARFFSLRRSMVMSSTRQPSRGNRLAVGAAASASALTAPPPASSRLIGAPLALPAAPPPHGEIERRSPSPRQNAKKILAYCN